MYTAKKLTRNQEYKDDYSNGKRTYTVGCKQVWVVVNSEGQVSSWDNEYDGKIMLDIYNQKGTAQQAADWLNAHPEKAARRQAQSIARFKEVVAALKAKYANKEKSK